MTVALYADYIRDLKTLFAELHQQPEKFQTFNVHVDMAAAGSLMVYETKRRKGQTDSIYYGRSGSTGTNRKVSQSVAFAAIDHFLGLGQFLAFSADTGDAGSDKGADLLTINSEYPHCAVNFSYRKKGQPVTRSMLMIFIGFNDEADALHYATTIADGNLVRQRPYHSDKVYEWK